MALREDIKDDQDLDLIEVEVLEADIGTGSKREYELTVADTLGESFRVIIWATHDVSIKWREGASYELSHARGDTWNDGTNRILHSTNRFTAERIGDDVSLLVMGDTHIGREVRTNDTGAPHRCARSFLTAVSYATHFDADAVIHTGDIFDDQVTTEDIVIARSSLEILEENGIPFYYIFGNHETARGKYLLEEDYESVATQIDTEGVRIADKVEIVGSDYISSNRFSISAADFPQSPNVDKRILVLHQDLAPVRDNGDVNLRSLINPPAVEFNYILSGHLHDTEKHPWKGIDVHYTGSTAKISTKPNADDPAVWLLTVTTDGVEPERINLS